MMNNGYHLFFLSLGVSIVLCEGFPAVPMKLGRSTAAKKTLLLGMLGPPEDGEIPPLEDIEEERRRLESLIQTPANADDDDTTSSFLSLPMEQWKSHVLNQRPPPPLTAIGRERLLTEITLLESLAYSDKAVQGLWDLWENWGGPNASKQLFEAEALVLRGGDDVPEDRFAQAETILTNLIEQQGSHITWVEPLYRLAYLWYLQERYEESKILCEIALAIKPWHFGARSTIVLVLKAMLHVNEMWDYSLEAMPALEIKEANDNNSAAVQRGNQSLTRQQWVNDMVHIAQGNLLERQEQFPKEIFQKAMILHQPQGAGYSSFHNDTQIDHDAWQ